MKICVLNCLPSVSVRQKFVVTVSQNISIMCVYVDECKHYCVYVSCKMCRSLRDLFRNF